jgi:hypothetical protein
MLTGMSNREFDIRITADAAFDDPVGYLGGFGIEAEIVSDTTLPAAA